MKIGPGTVVLNQCPSTPTSGKIIPAPQESQEMDGFVWIQWCDKSIGEDGVSLELLEDVTLTGRVVFV